MSRHLINRSAAALMAVALLVGAVAPVSAAVWTDQADYTPGSVVTISGDNSNGAGYLPGETVHVDVAGPNGYTSSCDATADENGAWSCQVTLSTDPDLAVGEYGYTATGQTSGTMETGTFTDNANVAINNSDPNDNSRPWYTSDPASVTISGTYTCTATGSPSCTTPNSVTVVVRTRDPANNGFTGTIVGNATASTFGGGNWSHTFSFADGASPSLGVAPDGLYDVRATFNFNGGSSTNSQVSDDHFGIDRVAPTVTVATAAPNPNNIASTGTASDATSGIPNGNVAVKLYSDNTLNDLSCAGTLSLLNSTTTNAGNWSQTFGGGVGTSQGDYCVTAQATDKAGNASSVAKRYYHITTVTGTSPANGATGVLPSANVSVTFSDPVNVTTSPSWITVTCGSSGGHAGSTSGGGTSAGTFDPTADFTAGETCNVTVTNNRVTPTGTQYYLVGNTYLFSFTVAAPDTTDPTNVSIEIDGGAAWTNSTTATLHIHGEDNVGVTGYFVANGGTATCLAEPFGSYTGVGPTASYDDAALAHALAAGDGTKTVCVVFRDAAGNKTADQDDIGLDQTAPSITKSIPGTPHYNDGSNDYVTSGTNLRVNVDEAGSGLDTCTISIDGPDANDTSFACSAGNNDFTLGGKLTTPPDGSYEISVSAEDTAGNPADDPLTVILDNTAPTYAETLGLPSFTAGGITYVKSTTNISVLGSDPGSGIASCTLANGGPAAAYTNNANFNLPTPDGAKSYTVACTDNLGNTSAGFTRTRTVDDTAPDNFAETIGSPSYFDGANTWVTSATPISVSGDDGSGSGVASCTKAFDGGATSAYTLGTDFNLPSGDGAHSYAIVCQDNLGNSNAALPDGNTLNVDNTGPVVSVTGVSDGATYVLGSVPVAGCSTTDGSGVGVATYATLTGPSGLSQNGVGTADGSCGGATDLLGNPQSPDPLNFTFYVIYDPAGVSGILQPINPDNTSVFKRGQAVPVKFRLGGDEFFGFVTTGWTIQRQMVACSVFDGQDAQLESVPSNTPSQYFRYDASADQYIYNADMHNLGIGTCWNFKVTLDSNQVLYSAVFKLTK